MHLTKDKREARWVPLDASVRKQIKTIKATGNVYGYIEFIGTKAEVAMAKRLGHPVPLHQAWVRIGNIEEHGGV